LRIELDPEFIPELSDLARHIANHFGDAEPAVIYRKIGEKYKRVEKIEELENGQHSIVRIPAVSRERGTPEFLKNERQLEEVDRLFGDWEGLVAQMKEKKINRVETLFDGNGAFVGFPEIEEEPASSA
jgi:hypothetical protein